jgi:hypothetical protein
MPFYSTIDKRKQSNAERPERNAFPRSDRLACEPTARNKEQDKPHKVFNDVRFHSPIQDEKIS